MIESDGRRNSAGGWGETPDDAPEEGQDYWSTAHPDNMVEVAAYVYDDGGAGDGNVTESVSFQYAAAAADWHATTPTADVTLVGYDWRDRPIAVKEGAMATVSLDATTGVWDATLTPDDEGTGDDTTARPMTADVLDNLGQPTAEYVFAANGQTLADVTDYVAAHPDDPNYDNLLRADTTNLFDPQGRVYETDVYSVEQTDDLPDSHFCGCPFVLRAPISAPAVFPQRLGTSLPCASRRGSISDCLERRFRSCRRHLRLGFSGRRATGAYSMASWAQVVFQMAFYGNRKH